MRLAEALARPDVLCSSLEEGPLSVGIAADDFATAAKAVAADCDSTQLEEQCARLAEMLAKTHEMQLENGRRTLQESLEKLRDRTYTRAVKDFQNAHKLRNGALQRRKQHAAEASRAYVQEFATQARQRFAKERQARLEDLRQELGMALASINHEDAQETQKRLSTIKRPLETLEVARRETTSQGKLSLSAKLLSAAVEEKPAEALQALEESSGFVATLLKEVQQVEEAPLSEQHAAIDWEKPEVGLCISGGGLSSACAVAGTLRALEHLNLAKEFTQLSVVGGSAWATAAYVFSAASAVHLLGAPTNPETLSLEVLDAFPVPLLRSVVANVSPETKEAKQPEKANTGPTQVEEVIELVASKWLEPYALRGRYFLAANTKDYRRILQQYPKMQDEKFLLPRTDRPMWIVGGSLVSEENQLPFQMTPSLITGPASSGSRTYEPIIFPFFRDVETDTLHILGSVQSFAFGGVHEDLSRISKTSPVLTAPADPFTLADMLTLSGLSQAAKLLRSDINRWPVKGTAASPGPEVAFTDGSLTDNSGLLHLLQRRVGRIVWVDFGWECIESGTPQQNNMNDMMEKFGCLQPGSRAFAKFSQVFREAEVAAMLQQLQLRRSAGEPGVVKRKLRVLPNERWQIKGDFAVDVVLIHIDRVNQFEDLLPEETRAELNRGLRGSFPNFPFMQPTARGNDTLSLTHRQANLLAALVEYNVRHASSLISSLVPVSLPVPQEVFPESRSRSLLGNGLSMDIHKEVLRAACDLNAIAREVQDVFWMRETATSFVSSQPRHTCDGQRAKGQLCFMHVSATEKEKRFSLQDSEAFDPMVGQIVGCLKRSFGSMLQQLAAVALSPPSDGLLGRLVSGFLGRSLARLYELKFVAEEGPAASDAATETAQNLATLTRAAKCMEANDFSGAVTALEGLTGDCQRMASSWLQSTRRALLWQQTFEALQAKARCLNAA
eukprot:symbB.v1.2.017592.t1/scaffold1330.1/size125110/10